MKISNLLVLLLVLSILSCSSPDSNYLGNWKTETNGETKIITITKYENSFLFEGDYLQGFFTKSKDGFLTGYKGSVIVVFDKKTKRLIVTFENYLVEYWTKVLSSEITKIAKIKILIEGNNLKNLYEELRNTHLKESLDERFSDFDEFQSAFSDVESLQKLYASLIKTPLKEKIESDYKNSEHFVIKNLNLNTVLNFKYMFENIINKPNNQLSNIDLFN